MKLLKCFTCDLAVRSGTPVTLSRVVRMLLLEPGNRAVAYYRIACWLRALRHPRRSTNFLAAMLLARLSRVPGVEIAVVSEIGEGLSLPHPHDIVLGHGAQVGARVTIYNGVTLGARKLRAHDNVKDKLERYPIIEDEVTIFSGAKILGPVRIGARSTVGANAVVLDSFPPGSTIVGSPARRVRPKDSEPVEPQGE